MNTNTKIEAPTYKSLHVLSRLLLQGREVVAGPGGSTEEQELQRDLLSLTRSEFEDLVALAHINHVIVRGLEAFLEIVAAAGDSERTEWAKAELAAESARISNALPFLENVCNAFGDRDDEVCVIKSLDHWPDLGSDLDLYTSADPDRVRKLMRRGFDATIAPRSWGDRLACKWNFQVPGLPELIEIHVGRLGQTGEQVSIASSLLKRTRAITVADRVFRVASKSDRLLISTLQRMYRHFYFRLCDIVDSAALVDTEGVDFDDLRASATRAGIWEGTATYLVIVSDYVKTYRGWGIDLPKFVTQAARFGGDAVYYSKGFIRVPIMPQSAKLYGSQLVGVLRKRELHNGARLSLLPWLATAAVVGQKITGSDKGIW
jgi:hypothetical protein